MHIPKLGGYMGGDGSLREKLTMLSLALNSDPEIRAKIPELMLAQRKKAEGDAFATDMQNFVGGKAIPQRPAALPEYEPPAGEPTLTGASPTDGSLNLSGLAQRRPISVAAPQIPMRDPSADAFGGPVSVRGALPILARGLAKGQKVTEWRELLEKAEPKAMNVNGHVFDERDPSKLDHYYGEAPTKGSKPAYDDRGQQIGWVLENGTLQAISQTEEAGALGKARGGIMNVPMRDGTEVPMTGGEYLDTRAGRGGVPQPAGFGVRQSEAEKTYGNDKAKTQAEREANAPKAFSGLQDQARATDFVLSQIDKILGDGTEKNPGLASGWTTGFMANLGGIKGTPAHDLETVLDGIKSNVGFDALQKMRDNSPTGGALGAVSEQENRLLQSVLGSMETGQSTPQFRASLTGLREQLGKIREQRRQLYESQFNGAQGSATPAPTTYTPAQIEAEVRRRKLKVQ